MYNEKQIKTSYSRHDLIQEGMCPSEWDNILDASKAYCKENKLPMNPENLLGHARELVDKWRNNKQAIFQKKEELKELKGY